MLLTTYSVINQYPVCMECAYRVIIYSVLSCDPKFGTGRGSCESCYLTSGGAKLVLRNGVFHIVTSRVLGSVRKGWTAAHCGQQARHSRLTPTFCTA
jgi:hypothetical protein